MIDLSDKTMASILNAMLLRVNEQVNKREGSFIRTALSVASWAIEGIYIDLMDVQKQGFGITATGEYLDLKVAERGLTRHPATNEVCYMLCNLSNVELGFQFSDASSNTWKVVSDVISGPDENDLYRYEITCQTPGNIAPPTGDLRSLSFLAGLVTARFDGIISPGQDVETDEQLRKRYEESLVEIAFAGNVAAYRERMLEMEYTIDNAKMTIGALQVFAATDMAGNEAGGNVKIYIVDSDFNVASPYLISAVQNEICPMYNGQATSLGLGFAPIGASVHIASATSTPVLSIAVTVDLKTGASISAVRTKVIDNIKKYIKKELSSWGTQVETPDRIAVVSIKKAFLYSAALVTGVNNVTSLIIRKDGVDRSYLEAVTWDTDRTTMEWINIDDAVITVNNS